MLKSFSFAEVESHGEAEASPVCSITKHGTAMEILEMRKRLGLTQQELADKLGVSQQLVSYWERGEREPNLEHQALLAEFIREMRKKERKTTARSEAEGRSGSSQTPQVIPDIPVEKKLDQLLDVLARYPNPTLHAQAANLFLQIGKPDEALDHINETLKARPDSPPFMMIQARCFLQKASQRRACDAMINHRGTRQAPRMKGEFKKAVPILEQLYEQRPYDSNIIARLAQAYHGAGETATAKELLVSAINLSLERGYKNRFLASLLCDIHPVR